MLEKSAASLEPCKLQRVLSQPARSAKRHRQLYRGFWQHGASALEIGSAWSSSPRVPAPQAEDAAIAPPQAGLNASAFFLDFLYPNATFASLRRTYPNLSRSSYQERSAAAARRRHFASSPSGATDERGGPKEELGHPAKSPQRSLEDMMRAGRISEPATKGKNGKATVDDPDDALAAPESDNKARDPRKQKPPARKPKSGSLIEEKMRGARKYEPKTKRYAKTRDDAPDDGLDVGLFAIPKPKSKRDIELEAYAAATALLANRPVLNPRDLPDVLSGPEDDRYLDVWDMYMQNDKDGQTRYRIQVLSYLSKSTGIVEIERCMTLIPRVAIEEWNDEFQTAAVLTFFRRGGLSAAVDQFMKGLEAKGVSGGLEYILSDAISNKKWPTVFTVWMAYYKICLDFLWVRDFSRLDMLATLPDLGSVCIEFEKWIADNNGPGELAAGAPSNRGLHIFRRRLADQALEQPCPPRQADVILASLRKHVSYHSYINRMIARWKENLETTGNLAMLPDIFQKYRQMKNYNPDREMLRAMFDLYYPRNAAGLEDIFNDWQKFFDSLDKLGYQKFLKYYSRAGDVQAVEALWARYIKEYPYVLKKPLGFRSIINVYAQIGDVVQAQGQVERMIEEFGVKPDIDIWNTMLKCCVRADDYELVLQTFENICRFHKADHFTYAHVMAMTSKRGDVAKTLEFFTRAQNEGVQPSKQMVLPLVISYCRNDMMHEAESVCVELAQRGITSTDSWTELIRCYGKQSKLDKCYEILQTMGKFGVEWDADTYEALFKAMVTQGHISDANNLLQRAFKEQLFTVDSEHFATIIAGAVRRGDLGRARSIRLQMDRMGVPMTFNAQVAIAWGVYKSEPYNVNPRKLAMDIVDSLSSVVAYPGVDKTGGTNHPHVSVTTRIGDKRQIRTQTSSIGQAIELLAELKQLQAIQDLVTLYLKIVPSQRENQNFPQYVNAALMKACLADGKYVEVQKIWNDNWGKVLATARRPDDRGIYPAMEYVLAPAMNVMVKMFMQQNDPRGLRECVKTVTDAGFKLSNLCWNNIVIFLCELGDWNTAVRWCEELLMDNWDGWASRPSAVRSRKRENSRLLWPVPKTMFALLSYWLSMRKLQDWSPEISMQLRKVEHDLPRMQKAFHTADLKDTEIRLAFNPKPTDHLAIRKALMELTYIELLVMRRWLYRQRHSLKRQDWQGAGPNPHIRGGKKDAEDPLTPQVIQMLEPTLQAKMEQGTSREVLLEEARARLIQADEAKKLRAATTRAWVPNEDAENPAFDVRRNAADVAKRADWIDIWEKYVDKQMDGGTDADQEEGFEGQQEQGSGKREDDE